MGSIGLRLSLVLVAAVLLASPSVGAQQADGLRRIGYLSGGSDYAKRKKPSAYHQAFLRGLAENGFVVGKNFAIEYRFAEGKRERLPALATELLKRKVEVIFGWADAARAAAKATTSVPVVFTAITDPVASGLVESLSRPGRNVTGLSNQGLGLSTKRLEFLKTAVPAAQRVAFLANVNHPLYKLQQKDLEAAAPMLGAEVRFVEVDALEKLASAFSEMKSTGVDALLVQGYSMFNLDRKKIADLAVEHHLPAMCEHAGFVRAGCLMSYGPDFVDVWRRAGGYVAKILKGAKPADLPVEQPTKFNLAINLKTAKALGITIPQSIMLRADRVIE